MKKEDLVEVFVNNYKRQQRVKMGINGLLDHTITVSETRLKEILALFYEEIKQESKQVYAIGYMESMATDGGSMNIIEVYASLDKAKESFEQHWEDHKKMLKEDYGYSNKDINNALSVLDFMDFEVMKEYRLDFDDMSTILRLVKVDYYE